MYAFASHGVFSGPASGRIAKSALTELVVLDTIPLHPEAMVRLVSCRVSCGVLCCGVLSVV